MTISAETFDEHKRVLWGMCYRMTSSAADADDIVQDTFVTALERLHFVFAPSKLIALTRSTF